MLIAQIDIKKIGKRRLRFRKPWVRTSEDVILTRTFAPLPKAVTMEYPIPVSVDGWLLYGWSFVPRMTMPPKEET